VTPMGTGTYHSTTLNKYRITWSTPNPAWNGGPPGTVNGAGQFHIGATFTGVDFNQPDPIIIQNVTLFDAGSSPLALHPRLPIYDAGTLDSASGVFSLNFQAPAGALMMLNQAVIYQLPRVASIDSMNGDQRPFTFDKQPIHPWSETKCAPQALRRGIRCAIAHIEDRPHILSVHKVGEPNVYDCSKGIPWEQYRRDKDSKGSPDSDGPICAASVRDPFPSTTVYVIATFVDPAVKHWDPRKRSYVTGPVSSKLYYQFAGVRNRDRLRKQSVEATIKR
jgi:hypothetical protein